MQYRFAVNFGTLSTAGSEFGQTPDPKPKFYSLYRDAVCMKNVCRDNLCFTTCFIHRKIFIIRWPVPQNIIRPLTQYICRMLSSVWNLTYSINVLRSLRSIDITKRHWRIILWSWKLKILYHLLNNLRYWSSIVSEVLTFLWS